MGGREWADDDPVAAVAPSTRPGCLETSNAVRGGDGERIEQLLSTRHTTWAADRSQWPAW